MSTSSTPGSRKRNLVAAALAITLGVYATLHIALLGLSDWAERTQRSHPYRHEDWLRYHADSYLGYMARRDVVLIGPSAVRENILAHGIVPRDRAAKVWLGAISQATLEDTVLGLEYLEAVHGREQIASTMVLGVTSRSVAGVVHSHSPFLESLDDYSPRFRVRAEGRQRFLADKGPLDAAMASLNYLRKLGDRYRCAASALVAFLLGDPSAAEVFEGIDDIRASFASSGTMAAVRRLGLRRFASLWFRYYAMPYKYHHAPSVDHETLLTWIGPDSLWGMAHVWDPGSDRTFILDLLKRLRAFLDRNEARLLVVNLPEHSLSRSKYDPDRYREYLRILREGLEGCPFLDARTFLDDSEFRDVIHATPAGAIRLTAEVDRFLHEHDGRPK